MIVNEACVVWHTSPADENIKDLERIQKSAVRIIIGEHTKSLLKLDLETLKEERDQLGLNFEKQIYKK